MLNKTDNIFHDKNLNTFVSQISEAFKLSCENFWEQDIKIHLQAINEFRSIRNEKLIQNIDFFSSQIKVENHKPVVIRLSKEFVDNILKEVLGTEKRYFKLSEITPLEIKILNAFCEFTYKKLNEVLVSTKEVKISEKSEKNINLLFILQDKNKNCSKIMISIPQDRINLLPFKKVASFKDEDFLTSKTTVNINAGNSKITFEELQSLTKDDIIVLENSDLNKMTLISGKIKDKFNIKINSSLIVNINDNDNEDEENLTYKEVNMEKNLWDDIQIEINAEFERVKMTIGELKQITQGQIVDLGSIFDNEISLFVEDRKVAKGELIIINDRYAVRLNEVFNAPSQKIIDANVNIEPKKQEQPKTKTQQSQTKPQSSKKAQVMTDEEEFDYSDFEK